MKSKKKLVEEYIQKIISKLCYEYGASLEDARKAVEELDLLNRYKGNYDFVLYQNVSTWVNLIVDEHKKEVERENLKNKTTVRPLSNFEKVEKVLKENTMENYIVINGKKAELTEEQLKQLGIEVKVKKETLFTRHSNELYWSINAMGGVTGQHEYNADFDNALYDNVNYFNDYKFAEQVALHQLLYRKLLKYAWDNNAKDHEWDEVGVNPHYYIYFDSAKGHFIVGENHYCHSQNIYFSSEKVAKQAIEDVIEPFTEEHPEFIW